MCKQLMESEVEGFEPYTPEEIIERLEAYYLESWWRTTRHDFSNFVKHFDKFIVKETRSMSYKTEPKRIGEFSGPKIECHQCGKAHGAMEPCPPSNVTQLLNSIPKAI
jgi:hypothetical protein